MRKKTNFFFLNGYCQLQSRIDEKLFVTAIFYNREKSIFFDKTSVTRLITLFKPRTCSSQSVPIGVGSTRNRVSRSGTVLSSGPFCRLYFTRFAFNEHGGRNGRETVVFLIWFFFILNSTTVSYKRFFMFSKNHRIRDNGKLSAAISHRC